MRPTLKQARENADMKQKETAKAIGISERYYQYIEAGTREGKGYIWDKLENLFCTPQQQLRQQMPSLSGATEGEGR